MKESLVSIIVPIYNAKIYLEECINSIISQSYENLEIFLVDDGSTDGSAGICDKYAEKDDRIVVLHKKNGGQADARNMALEQIKGDYIAFADSDDILSNDYIEYMLNLAQSQDADIVQCEYIKFWNDEDLKRAKNNINEKNYESYDASGSLREFSYQRKFAPSPWCKLIRRKVWGDIKFPLNMGYEDYAIMYKVLGRASKLIYSSHTVYFYRIHNLSTQHDKFTKKKKDRIIIADSLLKYVKENYPEIEQAARCRYCLAQLQYLMELPFDEKYRQDKKETMSNLKKYRASVLRDREVAKTLKIMLVSSYLGANVLMVLGRIYMKATKR